MRKNIVIVSVVLVALVVVLGAIFWILIKAGREVKIIENQKNNTIVEKRNEDGMKTKCNDLEKISAVETAKFGNIKSLAGYQQLCDSFVTDQVMFFSSFPSSGIAARELAQRIKTEIDESEKFGIVPVIVMEPADKIEYVSLKKIADGLYQKEIETMFQELAELGADQEKDQIWIPYPEINTPAWNKKGFLPQDFSVMVKDFSGALKKYFPKAKVGVLLNSTSYNNPGSGWESGSYEKFDPYLSDIKNEEVDIFVIQGFPWVSSANKKNTISLTEASEFLQPKLALEAAEKLNVKEIWLNVGTFREMYTNDSARKQAMNPEARGKILSKIVEIAKEIQLNGFRTRIHLFADDKSAETEAVDWSYHWKDDEMERKILFDFIVDVYEKGLDFSVFDSKG